MRRAGAYGWRVILLMTMSGTGSLEAQPAQPPSSPVPVPEARADESPPRLAIGEGTPLTVDEVVESTLRHHPVLEMARRRREGALGRQFSAEGGFDPMLQGRAQVVPFGYYEYTRYDVQIEQPTPLWGASFFGGWRRGQGNIPDYYGEFRTLEHGEVRGGVRVPLWQDGLIDARRAAIRRADASVEAAEAGLTADRVDLGREAATAYWRWVATGARYRLAEAMLDLSELRQSQLAERVRAGSMAPIEPLENLRAVYERRDALIRSEREVEQSAIALSLFYRGSDGRPIIPPVSRLPVGFPAPATESARMYEAGLRRALAESPALRRVRASLRAAGVDLALAENRVSPRLDVTAAISRDLGNPSTPLERTLTETAGEGVLQLSIPLLLRESRGTLRSAKAQVAELRADFVWRRDQLVAQVNDAWSALRNARRRVDATTRAAEVARAVAEAERQRFALGSSNMLFVNLREAAAADAQQKQIDATAEYQRAVAAWQAITLSDPRTR